MQSSFVMAMELCRSFDGSQWDIDAAADEYMQYRRKLRLLGLRSDGN